MRFYRSQRVSKLIQEELAKIMARELDFEDSFATVTEVDVDKKMERAVVRVSVWPTEKAPKTLKLLAESRNRLQYLLTRKLNIKPMPRITFELDRGPERAANVEKLLIQEDNKRD